jgi:hypothetical protein
MSPNSSPEKSDGQQVKIYTSLSELEENGWDMDPEELSRPTLLVSASMRYALNHLKIPRALRGALETLLHDERATFSPFDDEDSLAHPYDHVPAFLKRKDIVLKTAQAAAIKNAKTRHDLEVILRELGLDVRYPE